MYVIAVVMPNNSQSAFPCLIKIALVHIKTILTTLTREKLQKMCESCNIPLDILENPSEGRICVQLLSILWGLNLCTSLLEGICKG